MLDNNFFLETSPRLLGHDQYSLAVGSITPSLQQLEWRPTPHNQVQIKKNKQTHKQNKTRDQQIANADRGGLKDSCQVEERKTEVKSMNPKTLRYTLEFSVTIDGQTTPFFLSAL